tara:strand:- start:2565 stop:2909 length:345 start_codon:yes stop_codon:yes gene_type:complete
MKLLLEKWRKLLYEAPQHYEMIVSIKSQPETSLYGSIYNSIRAIPGITIVKTTTASEKDHAGNKISILSLKFMMEPGIGHEYMASIKDRMQGLQDEQGDKILAVRILRLPQKIK